MKKKSRFLIILTLALILPAAMIMVMAMSGLGSKAAPPRAEGPCDVYAAAGNPCVAAHSSTRALYASYNGPLYQVMRQSDGKTLDIGVAQPSEGDPGGYADAAAQDAFCANTYCWITVLYDQSGKGNHLTQAPRGGFSGPAMGGFNNLPVADMAPVTIQGHKVYGVFIEPGMGLRDDDPVGTAVDDQAEGQYWVISGHHYNSGCCFDYGNAETDSRDDGDGTMETTYYGNATAWYRGQAPGPWIMTDQENNLVGCVNPSPNDKYCSDLPSISWRFVTATADGEPHHWRSMGGDAQQGNLQVMFDGSRVINDRSSYDPMRKQGAILLGNGGDNSVGSQGTFYEGAMTAAGTFPTQETNQKIQANVVAAKYNVHYLSIAPANETDTPPGLQTFSPRTSQNTTVTFTNSTGASVKDVTLSITVPRGWKSVVLSTNETSKKFSAPVAPGESVSATFTVTSGSEFFNGDLIGKATWTDSGNGRNRSETTVEKVRNVSPVKINEFRVSDGSADNSTNSFIELYNAGDSEVDISGWTLTQHQTQMPIFSSVKIPAGIKLSPRSFYLLGLSNSGLVVPAKKGEKTIYVRNTTDMSVGDMVQIGTGPAMETRRIVSLTAPSAPETPALPFGGGQRGGPRGSTTVWQPLPDGPVITIPKGSVNIPVTSVSGFEVGQKMAIGYGATYPSASQFIEKYEIVTITQVGKPGTQAWLSMDAKPGDRNIKVSSVENISPGDKIRLDIDSKGHGIETVTVKRVGTQSSRSTFNGPLTAKDDPGTGLDLTGRLKFNHASNMPFSARGTGISFKPATAFAHSSNEPVLALSYSITFDQPLANDHDIDDVVRDEKVNTAGYQGAPAPDQWFGGPALSASAGNMVLRDANGNVVDGLNYGLLVDPWAAEGYQAASGAGASGCLVPAPSAGRGFRMGQTAPASQPNRSAGRYPDGADSDFNCRDFQLQNAISLLAPAAAGSKNIKVGSVANFVNGQKIIIGSGRNSETAVIAIVGTTGGTTVGTATKAGITVIPVVSMEGFNAGQSITIDGGANLETAVVASTSAGRRRMGPGAGGGSMPMDSIKVTMPLKFAHAVGAQVSGSGITLTSPLTKAHENGEQLSSNLPTPGEPNQYVRRP
ncbi:MAG TPA: arabinofuranosidase catalytic domain-containing protein [Bacteroidales bacterium]|nr:alpha-N-arabinofuranosidase [Bacteroidales bacterium]HOU00859.1 arabinofuranosidase catalytic domain-containing protein [Bacteroidales bacterium]HQK66750.1 arabinofuranosidase catalytic domain-containing protein [Bacteroidales bacterium]